MSRFLSNNYSLPPDAGRPKVVLVNPNFQRKQALSGKTIHVNPSFKPITAPGKQSYISNRTAASPSSNLVELAQACDIKCSSLINKADSTSQNFNFVCEKVRTSTSTCALKSCFLSKSKNDSTIQSNSSQSLFESNNSMPLTVSKVTSQPLVLQHGFEQSVHQPKKTFVNPKFLKTHENTDAVVEKKASFFYVNVKKLKLENETERTKETGLHEHRLKYSIVNSDSKVCPSLAEDSGSIVMKETCNTNNSNPQEKVSVYSYPATTSSSSSVSCSTLSGKSVQKKKMNLLRLRKITRLAQLAQLSCMRKKDIKLSPHIRPDSITSIKKLTYSNKFAFKKISPISISCIQNSVPQKKSNFPSHSIPFHRKSVYKKCSGKCDRPSITNDHPSTYQQSFQKCSKFKLVKPKVLKYHVVHENSSNKTQLRTINNFAQSDPSTSKSNQMQGKNLVSNNLQKYVKVNMRKRHQSSSPNISNIRQESAPDFKIKENISENNIASDAQKLLYVSNKKLIRKLPTKKNLLPKNGSNISKNKYIFRNINLIQSKNYATCFKINFKPSRTSSDVINKRIIQRKVINRYKLLNIQQNLLKAENSITSSAATGESMKSERNYFFSRKGKRDPVKSNKNSSFISIGKTKLIRKSILKQKQRSSSRNNLSSRKVRVNNLQLINATNSKFLKKRNSQNFSANTAENSENIKATDNNLIAFGKTKLIKQSLIHWQRQVNELRTKRNNVAATSVIHKQLKKFYKSLPETHQNMKLFKKASASKQKSTNSFSCRRNKQLTKKRIALRCKNNIPCETFHKYGRCKKSLLGKCFKLHDKKFIAICQAFIQGACKNDACLLSHEIIPQKMSTCHHFLQGACSRDNCLYPHVKLSAKAPVCRDFVRGFCSLGLDCDKLHVLVCPELEKEGICSNRPNCKFAHRKKRKTIANKSFGRNEKLNSATIEQSSKPETAADFDSKSNNETSKRYFSKSSDNELEAFIPKRPQLGSLPSFIPLNSCDL